MNEVRLRRALEGLGTPQVLIVGDLILDRYVVGDVARISPEAPIPVLRGRYFDERLGGAGNVAANLYAMQAQVGVVGVVGRDPAGERQVALLEAIDVETSGCVQDGGRPSTVKTRMISGVHQMLRVDWEDARALSDECEAQLVEAVVARAPRADAVVLSDYGKGVLTERVLRAAIDAARGAGVPVLVDPKGKDYRCYRGATLVTPNRKEAEEALGRSLGEGEGVAAGAAELIELCELDAAVITLGAEGIYYRSASEALGRSEGRVAARAREVFDVTGAGDTVIAHLALALAGGLDLETAVHLANHAASLVVARRGAASVTREEVLGVLGTGGLATGKILRREDLPRVIADWRARGKRVVFTNGCFDILHAGHVDYLRFARSRGDVLLVGVNDDASVRRLKGPERPINTVHDRLEVLAALEMVDGVVPFGEDTPAKIVEEVTPDILVKGEDWRDKGVVGREWVEKHGGEVHLAPLVPGRSTSAIADKLRRSEPAG